MVRATPLDAPSPNVVGTLAENQRQRERVRERMRADNGVPYADGMTRVLFDTLTDERYVRLWAWSQLHAADVETSSANLAELVDAIEEGIRSVLPDPRRPDRARIEMAVLVTLSGAYGFALGRRSWLAGLGHDPNDRSRDEAFRTALSSAIANHLAGR